MWNCNVWMAETGNELLCLTSVIPEICQCSKSSLKVIHLNSGHFDGNHATRNSRNLWLRKWTCGTPISSWQPWIGLATSSLGFSWPYITTYWISGPYCNRGTCGSMTWPFPHWAVVELRLPSLAQSRIYHHWPIINLSQNNWHCL